jgi:predicted chitinase
MITIDQLKACYKRMMLNPRTCAALYPHLVAALVEAKIDTQPRIASFLAQCGHESGEFKYMEEIWGPTPQQLRYDPPTTLAAKLGNTNPGDGYRFRGAGPIQVTGKAQFTEAGKALGLDLEHHPEQAFTPAVGFRMAAWFWNKKNLNQYADKLVLDPAQDISTQQALDAAIAAKSMNGLKPFDWITQRINGGFNGRDDRNRRYGEICRVLKQP